VYVHGVRGRRLEGRGWRSQRVEVRGWRLEVRDSSAPPLASNL